MMKTPAALLLLSVVGLAAGGCAPHYHHGRRGYIYQPAPVVYQPQPVYYQQPAPVYYQQQPAPVVYQQQPAPVYQQQQAYPQQGYEEQPVVLQQPPTVYYYQPTGAYRRPALYGGVRVYIAP